MRFGITFAIVVLAAGLAARPAAAQGCRARCRKAIAACVTKNCAQFHGALKGGCKRGFRITLIGACKAAPAGDACEQVQASGCSDS